MTSPVFYQVYFKMDGINSVIPGNIKVSKAQKVTVSITHSVSGKASSYRTFKTRQAVNKLTERGGVKEPTIKAISIATPKCTVPIPKLCAIGKSMGVTRIIIHIVSIKVPNSSSKRNIKANIKNLLDVMDKSQFANKVGTF